MCIDITRDVGGCDIVNSVVADDDMRAIRNINGIGITCGEIKILNDDWVLSCSVAILHHDR